MNNFLPVTSVIWIEQKKNFYINNKTQNKLSKSIKRRIVSSWAVSVSANPIEEGRTVKVSLVYTASSRPVRAINGDPVSESQPFSSTF